MNHRLTAVCGLVAAALGISVAMPAQAASPTKVTADWKGGASGLPSDITMYIYVPSKVAPNPPIVTLVHSCSGSGPGVFSQATGNGTSNGGVVQAADKYGFIMVMPDSGAGRCWDISSKTTQTRDGAADSHAIVQMVKYAISQYKGNADRVYATGCSSGAMMTQLLLALYPDVFKAGSSFAGVPAGCSNAFDGSGLCGLSAQTAQQWGDRVRAMYKDYSGHRPRVQLVHGDADGTITYKNQAEAIKEWTNVLGLSTTPTSTATSGLTLGTHQATRQSWKNSCGYMVLDALTSVGGDHGPSDALFQSSFVLPFLGLDSQTAVDAAVDPEIEQCGGGGTGDAGAGGGPGSGGATGTGGSTSGAGGSTGAGGGTGGGRDGGPGREAGNNGGAGGDGGATGTGGATGSGGKTGSGGSSGTGGKQGSGGTQSSGGVVGSGGTTGSGGTSASSGNGGNGSGGTSSGAGGKPGSGGSTTGNVTETVGCNCAMGESPERKHPYAAFALGLALLALVRRRRRG